MKAYYWNNRTLELRTLNGDLVLARSVSGKKEARRIAKEYRARCCNF